MFNDDTLHSLGSHDMVKEGHLNNSSSKDHRHRIFESRGSNDHKQQ